jgi:hypothetical protein
MSAVSQTLRFDPLPAASGLPRLTNANRPARLVRWVPASDIKLTKLHRRYLHWKHFLWIGAQPCISPYSLVITPFWGFRDVTFCGQVFADNSVRCRSIIGNVR